ncbi:uncharacterized protein PFL1_01136 [Pseudozyma flocculosa PF-1]|uniref:aminodeoxychorismate synthase n=1 Tax=Pseudozyma flocculosa TaxID=84751 RepID=A0A5C3EW42_9BASI|nr:uncharacterized protein PFL1_01136 [Pseudozyma flocculosa PF-1]EPQ30947.1 hypothetical protein PFL1_01136 [Pseudozyma flocculosa PF-1]SPO35776.1 related to para-aminobenzoic acid synthetase [Pseudozyma flocculosa]
MASPAAPTEGRLPLPRILIVDHHDSYTLNLFTLLLPDQPPPPQQSSQPRDTLSNSASHQLSERVFVLPHTHPLLRPDAFRRHVRPHIDAIILSPGPGSPDNPDDFGAADALLRDDDLGLPVLGVCLGHQGLATAFGGRVVKARSVRHGLKTALCIAAAETAKGQQLPTTSSPYPCLLEGIAEGTQVIRYNSLTVDIDTLPSCLRVTAWGFDEPCKAPLPHTRPRTDLLRSCVQHALRPAQSGSTTPRYSAEQLAASSGRSTPSDAAQRLRSKLALDSLASDSSSSLGELDEDLHDPAQDDLDRVVLALQHRTRPLYGVQFHPESIESSSGRHMMRNFLAIVRSYWAAKAEAGQLDPTEAAARRDAIEGRATLPAELRLAGARCVAAGKAASLTPSSLVDTEPTSSPPRSKDFHIISTRLDVPPFECERLAPELFRRAFQHKSNVGAVWLDSARLKDPHSRFSYMAVPTFVLSYNASTRQLRLMTTRDASKAVLVSMDEPPHGNSAAGTHPAEPTSFWTFMDRLQSAFKAAADLGDDDALATEAAGSVFRTGFVGYFGYEMKGESLNLDSPVPSTDADQHDGRRDRPDCEFLFCDRVLAFDHHLRQWTAFALTRAGSSPLQAGATSTQPCWPVSAIQDALRRSGSGSDDVRAQQLAVTESEAQQWFDEVSQALHEMPDAAKSYRAPAAHAIKDALPPLQPRLSADEYMHRIELARDEILRGESYELCLTTQFRGRMPPLVAGAASDASGIDRDELDHFGLYCKLRARNPAPYSAFIRLPDHALAPSTTEAGAAAGPQRGRSILCTSPERFIRITQQGEVEMKPIKGTLARAGYGQDEEGMRAGGGTADEEEEKLRWRQAGDARRRQRLAADVKERAENLMIVDLIRADLQSFCHADSVVVPKLMSVETYETVHQLVTTVRGQLKRGVGSVEAVQRCFPPGSMTGAPKRRSVQLLERLELSPSSTSSSSSSSSVAARRGVYSGALGWMGIDGAADFAVVIRTLVAEGDDVSIGAGGAITYLSDPAKEWIEVLDKLRALANVHV